MSAGKSGLPQKRLAQGAIGSEGWDNRRWMGCIMLLDKYQSNITPGFISEGVLHSMS